MTYSIVLSDNLPIEENLERSGNNINLGLTDAIILEAVFIIRSGDTAFIRSNIY